MKPVKSILAGLTLALGLGSGAIAQDALKVGFVYVGPVGDGGWTYYHDVARLAAQDHFGDAVETTFVESVPDLIRVPSLKNFKALDALASLTKAKCVHVFKLIASATSAIITGAPAELNLIRSSFN